MTENPSTKSIEKATKKSWDDWLKFMNKIGAKDLIHKDIAIKVNHELEGKIDNPGWWAQSVTVAYEQHSGRRITGQRSDGTFEATVSKSTQLNMEELMNKWAEFAAKDTEVNQLINKEAKIGGTQKRIYWRTKSKQNYPISIVSEPKKNGTATILANQTKIPTKKSYEEAKAKWTKILERFVETLI